MCVCSSRALRRYCNREGELDTVCSVEGQIKVVEDSSNEVKVAGMNVAACHSLYSIRTAASGR